MLLRSNEVVNKKFPQVKGGIIGGNSIGYERNAVELFVEDVYETLLKLEDDNESLRDHVRKLMEEKEVQEIAGTATLDGEQIEELKRRASQIDFMEKSLKRMFFVAEQQTQQIKDDAVSEAKSLLEEAQAKAEALLREANARYEEKQKEAEAINRKAQEVEQKLRNLAESILKESAS